MNVLILSDIPPDPLLCLVRLSPIVLSLPISFMSSSITPLCPVIYFSFLFSHSLSLAFMSPLSSLNLPSVRSNSSMQRHTGNILPCIVHKLYCLGRSLTPPQPSLSFYCSQFKAQKIYVHCPPFLNACEIARCNKSLLNCATLEAGRGSLKDVL